jgi:hypothetical protein
MRHDNDLSPMLGGQPQGNEPMLGGDKRRFRCHQCGALYPQQEAEITVYHLASDRQVAICGTCKVSIRTMGHERIVALQQSFAGDLKTNLPKNGQYLRVGHIWSLIEHIERFIYHD